MLISTALAMDASTLDTGSSGGAIALSIILGIGILLYAFYSASKRWRRHRLEREGGEDK